MDKLLFKGAFIFSESLGSCCTIECNEYVTKVDCETITIACSY